MNLSIFNSASLFDAATNLFSQLGITLNSNTAEPIPAKNLLKEFYKDNSTFSAISKTYFIGIVDDTVFIKTDKSGHRYSYPEALAEAENKYDGLMVFALELSKQPTRSEISELTRAFNRISKKMPVALVFKYFIGDNLSISFANTERSQYQQHWHDGEKIGKVSMLRDINIEHPHRGHLDILEELQISASGKDAVTTFAALYKHWQDVFSVSILNKKFYKELQTWYFWAVKEVAFPNGPLRMDFLTDEKFDEAIKEHKGKNVIRLLTRILFIWFIKEKKLIPEQLFDEKFIEKNLIKDFTPQKPKGFFATGKHSSQYYRAILQNLFFASLNQEMRKRAFRIEGQNQNVTNLMRYKNYFKNPDYFVQLMEEVVPFMNGGLFECLDKPHPTIKGKQGGDIIIYNDGFSDRDDNSLIVPDYLFFDVDEDVDISENFEDKKDKNVNKNAKTRGLLEILKSYKFTITENTPMEEDVALDPELLGKVFENLLASYNPETKSTARKQTGSFYTPREIVNYMVDESLIAYLKTQLADFELEEEQLDKDLHTLLSFSNINPFEGNAELQKKLIVAIDQSSILDPACGSGAFPMGILHKMVLILHKIDPNNSEWKQRQLDRVDKAIESLEEIDDVRFREQSIKELEAQKKDIDESFANNELDYGRKLYLIENCIFGVDIQPIATQISKLRFFISLIVDQKIDKTKADFGIRPLPNLETKFVAANTLIGIANDNNLSNTDIIRELKKELKQVRHRLFSAKTPATKQKLRKEDETVRKKIADELKKTGWENKTADQLASWDPYDQNESSSFFDAEWMFDLKDGFDVVIGNPPYVQIQKIEPTKKIELENQGFDTYENTGDLYQLFYEHGIKTLKNKGTISFITSNKWMRANYGVVTRSFFSQNTSPILIIDFGMALVFETATILTNIFIGKRTSGFSELPICRIRDDFKEPFLLKEYVSQNTICIDNPKEKAWVAYTKDEYKLIRKVENQGKALINWNIKINRGILTGCNEAFIISQKDRDAILAEDSKSEEIIRPILRGEDIKAYFPEFDNLYLIATFPSLNLAIDNFKGVKKHLEKFKERIEPKPKKFTGDIWNGRKSGSYEWFETQDSIAYHEDFAKPKIIYPNMTKFLPFVYDETGILTNQKCFIISGEHLKYLTGVFNSSLWKFSFRNRFPELLGETFELSKVYFDKMPIKIPCEKIEVKISEKIDDIIKNKRSNHSSAIMERQVDELIYKHYELTYEEVKVVDPAFWLSEEEYAEIKIE